MEYHRFAAASPGLRGSPETRRQGALDSIADIALDAQGPADVTAAVDAAGKTFQSYIVGSFALLGIEDQAELAEHLFFESAAATKDQLTANLSSILSDAQVLHQKQWETQARGIISRMLRRALSSIADAQSQGGPLSAGGEERGPISADSPAEQRPE